MEPIETWTADSIDLSDLDFWRRPWDERHAAFATLRRERPISHYDEPVIEDTTVEFPVGKGFYALTKHRDVQTVSRHPEVFLSGPGAVSTMDLPSEMVEYFSGMISTDDPKHARLRRIVSNAFNPRNVRAVEDSIERKADEIIDRASSNGSGDFISDVAAAFPLEIICDMMGVPPSEYATVLRHSNVILSFGDSDIIPEGHDPILELLESGAALTGIMEELGKYRIDHPIDDITSALVNAEIETEKLTQQELASFFVLLVTAGNETTRTAIAHGLIALTEHPSQKARLLADYDGLARTATDEIVRWASPVMWMRRTLAEDYTLSGVDLAKGDKVLMYYVSANRDEDVFESPDIFDVGRSPNDHYGFGAPGPHFCLGAHLARREITVIFRELLKRHPDIQSAGPPSQLQSSFINGIKYLKYNL
ncbi:MAG TPA: cytochrome P450 [Acidimicrobiales bacterium]|nr:cytochrome P450 [Acidimicrobiales bacterium]